MLADKSVRDLLAAFASGEPTPGGGSASALASAVGAALLTMVAGLPKTRDNSEEDRRALQEAAAVLADVRRELTDAIDGDTAAYDRVVAAYKLPKTSSEEVAVRKAAIQRALRAATDVPLAVMRLSARAIEQGAIVAAHGNRAAASDVGVAIALLRTGAHGAKLNAEINLEGITDSTYRDGVRGEIAKLEESLG